MTSPRSPLVVGADSMSGEVYAGMAELVDAADLSSAVLETCGFDSHYLY